MKLANPDWINTLTWDYLHPASLILESPEDYKAAVSDLTVQMAGGEGTLVLSENGEICSLQKTGLLVRDLWSVDINQKKLLNGVYKQVNLIGQEDHYAEIAAVMGSCENLMQQVTQELMLPMEWDIPADLTPLMKALGVRLEPAEDPVERLVDYAHLSQEFLHIRFLILIGIRSFLTDSECNALCRDFIASELPVLLVDPVCRPCVTGEIRLIIDAEHCEILIS